MKVAGIIAAGGRGERLGVAGGKQLLEVAGRPVAAWATDALAAAAGVDSLVVVCDPARVDEYAAALGAALTTEKPVVFVAGGQTRAQSVYAGLQEAADADLVAIHDGARPLLDPTDVDRALALLDMTAADAVVLGHPAINTLKRVDAQVNRVIDTPSRDDYWEIYTPQIFRRSVLLAAYEVAATNGFTGTDDASYLEHAGGIIATCLSSRHNLKITTADDLDLARRLLVCA